MSQKALNRLMIKLTKENLWIYIVKLLMERPMYGYEIAKEIRERFNIDITNVGVYVVLYKMERDGLLETFISNGSKMYRLRPDTIELWLRARDFISSILKQVFNCGVDCGPGKT
ncbi:PadR family transcriptional regulator [Vulcanisaeta distributa]|uniref:Transcriptional regulator, PadR-like family n=1 Tax=Vulcanisaeta distributa (strain DSM 14429 / JCM 11212 / NBRC 100878 / IC-017) TaxID=572478 RepID=E1QV20_VULDI|nr:PadR family transcriptional regulator [Vulcanisaeta distributa]ADN51211.1 transcriptional regulator, PadR-like family [Vulcanisaeta distributa DSM 14429]